jgi:hypothetical protein
VLNRLCKKVLGEWLRRKLTKKEMISACTHSPRFERKGEDARRTSCRHAFSSYSSFSPPPQHRPQHDKREREDGLAEGKEGVVDAKWKAVNEAVLSDAHRAVGAPI